MSKIMVVAEDDGLAEALEVQPRELYEFYFSHPGDGLIDTIHKVIPDLIIIDSTCSVNTTQLVRQIRSELEFLALPVIMITENGLVSQKKQMLAAGADDYLERPLDETVLIARIERVLRMARLEKQLHEMEKLASAGQIAFKMKHDVNNPLAGIIATAQLLQMQVNDPVMVKKLSTIEELAFRISEMMENLGRRTTADDIRLTDRKVPMLV